MDYILNNWKVMVTTGILSALWIFLCLYSAENIPGQIGFFVESSELEKLKASRHGRIVFGLALLAMSIILVFEEIFKCFIFCGHGLEKTYVLLRDDTLVRTLVVITALTLYGFLSVVKPTVLWDGSLGGVHVSGCVYAYHGVWGALTILFAVRFATLLPIIRDQGEEMVTTPEAIDRSGHGHG